jgi:hypothetical protein
MESNGSGNKPNDLTGGALLKILIIIVILFILIACSQDEYDKGSDFKFEENIDLQDFNKIEIKKGHIDLFFTQSEEKGIVVKTQQSEHLKKVSFEYKDNALTVQYLGSEKFFFWKKKYPKVQLYISYPVLESLSHAVIGDVVFTNGLTTDSFTLRFSGVGDIKLKEINAEKLDISSSGVGDLQFSGAVAEVKIKNTGVSDIKVTGLISKNLEVTSSGTGDITLSGSSDGMLLDVSGVADVDAKDFICRIVKVKVMGVGDAKVYCSEELDATVMGVGDVTYYGSPQTIRQSVKGMGDINKGD